METATGPLGDSLLQNAPRTAWDGARKAVYAFLHPDDEAHKSHLSPGLLCVATAFQHGIIVLVFLNILLAMGHAVLNAVWGPTLDDVEASVSVATTFLFAAEYIARFWTCVEAYKEFYLPKKIRGIPVLSPFEKGNHTWIVDNSKLQSSLDALAYRKCKDMDKLSDIDALWGAKVQGCDTGDGWIICNLQESPGNARRAFALAPLNILDLVTTLLMLSALLLPQVTGSSSAVLRLGRVGRIMRANKFWRAAIALNAAVGSITQSRVRSTISLLGRQKKLAHQRSVIYDDATESWVLSTDLDNKASHNIWEHAHAEDAFGFDATSGRRFRLLLVMLAVSSSATSFFVDRGVQVIGGIGAGLHGFLDGALPPFAVTVSLNILLVCAARFATHLVPQAAGSGLPEVKCILSGATMDNFLTGRVYMAKTLGLTLAIGGGLPVGKEGPFVHIAACVSCCLLRLPIFEGVALPIDDVLLAAVAVGVGATFSAPIGGVLFALELMMPRLYDVTSYAPCFFASTIGTLTFMSLNMLFTGVGSLKPLFSSNIVPQKVITLQAELVFIVMCVAVGAVCGSLGSIFVQGHRRMVSIMNVIRGISPPGSSTKPRCGASLSRDLLIMAVVAVGDAALQTYGRSILFRLGAGPLLTQLFTSDSLEDLSNVKLLAWAFVAKVCLTMVALSLPVPAGVVAPTLILGALMGRLLAAATPDFLRDFIRENEDWVDYEVRFAIVGATAFCGSTCRVISVVVTVFEVLALPRLILPLALATITANYCGNKLGPSIFDSILVMKKVPGMPTLRAAGRSLMNVASQLQPQLRALALRRHGSIAGEVARVEKIIQELQDAGYCVPNQLPIVEEVAQGRQLLVGTISTENLPTVSSAGGRDLLEVVVSLGLLESSLQVRSDTSLKQAYLFAQSSQQQGPLMIVDEGMFIGVLPRSDLLKIGSD